MDAKREIKESLSLCNFCYRMIGINLFEDGSKTFLSSIVNVFATTMVALILFSHISVESTNVFLTISHSPQVETVVPLLHIYGYLTLSVVKLLMIWYKKDVFRKLFIELENIWPVPPLTSEEEEIKKSRITRIRIAHSWYFWITLSGIISYSATPAIKYFLSDRQQRLEGPFPSWYPFDKYAPVYRLLTYVYESGAGFLCVWLMVGSDLLFTGLASHIGMLLRLLHRRLINLAPETVSDPQEPVDLYNEIIDIVKRHQKLIQYCGDIEGAFNVVFLINIVLSSVNICCAMFLCVLLDPPFEPSNKVFVVAALYQMGILCWYGDDIFRANEAVGDAAYNGGWYRCDTRSRNALRFLIMRQVAYEYVRSNEPIGFTAMKFKFMNLKTYSSILTTSYSYFALLNSMYRN